MALFAHCASLTVNAVHEPWNRAQGRRHHANQLACAVSLDMAAAGWKPTPENYLNRVPKARILEAVTEAKSEDRKSVVEGKSVSVRVDLGARRHIKKKKEK